MNLATYMDEQHLSPEEMAGQLDDVSVSGLLKWLRFERVPRPEQMRRIFEVTGGKVTPNDFVLRDAAPVAERVSL